MRPIPILVALLFLFPFAATAQPTPRPIFGHEESDLKPDSRVRFGTLPNGLRYAVLENHEPKQRASLRLLVTSGSLEEEDNQRGLAHFLEHMAFNGSTHYPPGTMVEYFQRLGMSFGGDTNAYTSFDHTVYMLELPNTNAPTLEEGFRVFGDYAGGLLLPEDQIQKERGIILSEKRARDSVQYRQSVAEFDFLLGSTRIPQRMPIGLEKVIETADRGRFVSLYDRWYRPERMAVIAVGDFDGAAVEAQIKASLSGVQARSPAAADPSLGQLARFEGLRTNYHYEAEAPATDISIQTIIPYSHERDTSERRLRLLPRDLALAMLNRRFEILAKKEGAPFIRASASANPSMDFFLNASIDVSCKPEQWAAALRVGEQELRRALQYGFDPGELREATADTINALEQAVKTAPTRRSEDIAGELIHGFLTGSVFTTPEADVALYRPALEKVTPEECAAALRAAFAAPGRYVSVMGNAKLADKPEPVQQIRAAFEASTAEKLTQNEAIADAKFAYTDFGPPGAIASLKHVEDLDLDLITFANGVRLNLKKTPFEAGQIQVQARVGAGQLVEPRSKPGLSFFSSAVFTAGGLGKHSIDDLQRILAGKTLGVGFHAGNDALVLSGTTNQTDLLLQLQLLAAFLTDPGYRPESLRLAQKRFEPMYQQLQHTPSGPLQLEVPRILASGDPRFGIPQKPELMARTLEEEKAWLTPQFAQGPVEIAIVGDIDPEKTVEAAAQTFGALPKREPKPAYEEERRVAIPSPAIEKEFRVPTEIPKGVVAVYWPTTDARDVKRARRLNLLANVVSDRLRVQVREKLGESYSPEAASATDDTYRNYGFLFAYVTIDPAKAKEVVDTVLTIGDDIVKHGITDDEFDRARKPLLTALRESARTNAYWLSAVLSSAQEEPQRLDWARSRYADTESMKKEEVEALAREYLGTQRAFRFVVIPESHAEPPKK
ncbi:peptidase M16 [Opitutaceae bacterium EW11]|nr:peptidase M16 [Opitutaceae bacterium EW11]